IAVAITIQDCAEQAAAGGRWLLRCTADAARRAAEDLPDRTKVQPTTLLVHLAQRGQHQRCEQCEQLCGSGAIEARYLRGLRCSLLAATEDVAKDCQTIFQPAATRLGSAAAQSAKDAAEQPTQIQAGRGMVALHSTEQRLRALRRGGVLFHLAQQDRQRRLDGAAGLARGDADPSRDGA